MTFWAACALISAVAIVLNGFDPASLKEAQRSAA